MYFLPRALALAAVTACLIRSSTAQRVESFHDGDENFQISHRIQSTELLNGDREGFFTHPALNFELTSIAGSDVDLMQAPTGNDSASFSVDLAGAGQAAGVQYTIPPYTVSTITVNLNIPALTSQNVQDLRDGLFALLDATQREQLIEHESKDSSLSANLGWFGFLSGGGKYTQSRSASRLHMESIGLTNAQIDEYIELFREVASTMNSVQMVITTNNVSHLPVSGQFLLWVMQGQVYSNSQQTSFRMLSDGVIAGDSSNQVPGVSETVCDPTVTLCLT